MHSPAPGCTHIAKFFWDVSMELRLCHASNTCVFDMAVKIYGKFVDTSNIP
jgi:hypothetical protein